jgi:hypothetical protein
VAQVPAATSADGRVPATELSSPTYSAAPPMGSALPEGADDYFDRHKTYAVRRRRPSLRLMALLVVLAAIVALLIYGYRNRGQTTHADTAAVAAMGEPSAAIEGADAAQVCVSRHS